MEGEHYMSAMASKSKKAQKRVKLIGRPKVIGRWNKIELVEQEYELGNKKNDPWKYVRTAPSVRVIIPTETEIILVREFRKEHNGYVLGLPGGKTFDTLTEYRKFLKQKKDISPVTKATACKEVNQEVGIIVDPKDMDHFYVAGSGSRFRKDTHYFIARKFVYDPEGQHLTESEDMEVVHLSFDIVVQLCFTGGIPGDRGALALLRWLGLNGYIQYVHPNH